MSPNSKSTKETFGYLGFSIFENFGHVTSWPIFWRVTLTLSHPKVEIWSDDDSSLINGRSYATIKNMAIGLHWPQVRSSLWPAHYKSMAKVPARPLKRIGLVQLLHNHTILGYYWSLWCNFASVTRGKVIRGHIMTHDIHMPFMSISFDRIGIGIWETHQLVHFGQAHHAIRSLIC